jgi:FtsP/CotA-like multicopper oxidase with cupredoxin domain
LTNNPDKDPTKDPVFQRFKTEAEKRLDAKVKEVAGVDQKLEAAGEWPEYWPGYYPYSFVIPKYGRERVEMGQAPGTHWYHAHKHGAAALQLLNGMSGAFIIEGDYDRELRATLRGIQEKVIVLQQYDSIPNQERAGNKAAPALQANGQLLPTIRMRPGEIQWWRIVNATIQANQINSFAFMESAALDAAISPDAKFQIPPASQRGNTANFRMIARDGVQFAWQNYNRHKADTEFRLAQGNRVDILVQAPLLTDSKPVDLVLVFSGLGQSKNPTRQNTVLRVRVENSNGPAVPTQWPVQWEPDPNDPTKPRGPYLTFPPFLADLPDNLPKRTVTFGLKSGGVGNQPQFTIDGKQFQDGMVDQCMVLDSMMEWTIVNQTTVPHPFHIHVNPFQIVEYFDPSKANAGTKMPAPYVWQDTIEIPANATSPDGMQRDGYVTMRSRFCDFTGKFVLHCHILGHEDRGMMQIVEVKAGTCPATPYPTALTHGH